MPVCDARTSSATAAIEAHAAGTSTVPKCESRTGRNRTASSAAATSPAASDPRRRPAHQAKKTEATPKKAESARWISATVGMRLRELGEGARGLRVDRVRDEVDGPDRAVRRVEERPPVVEPVRVQVAGLGHVGDDVAEDLLVGAQLERKAEADAREAEARGGGEDREQREAEAALRSGHFGHHPARHRNGR